MKTFRFHPAPIVALVLMFAAAACGGGSKDPGKDPDPGKEDPGKEPEKTVTLKASPLTLQFAADAVDPQTVTVETNLETWNITPSVTWLTVEKSADRFSVKAGANATPDARSGKISVWGGKAEPLTVTVSQAGFVEKPVNWATDPNLRTLKAFPGAEGFGSVATGGRGGKVLYVTNLNDSGAGSLRWAVEQQTGARTILFKVSGIIRLKTRLNIRNGPVTIAGQSAPGDGICIADNFVYQDADNVIVRYLRFRMGDLTDVEGDAFWGRNRRDIIIDHCSMSWSTDECASFYDNDNFTLQWCIIAESLRASVHAKGNHGYGGIWGGRRASFHHNLLAHHDSRNPRFNGSRYSGLDDQELVDFRNNVVFNWGSNSGYAGEGGRYNLVNNYYRPGAETGNQARIFAPDPPNTEAKSWAKIHVSGNYMTNRDGTPNQTVNGDNWTAIHPRDNYDKNLLRSDVEFEKGDIATQTAQEAFESVLAEAGASFRRDATDTRITNEARTGSTPKRASGNAGTKAGLIDTQSDVGGWDTYNSTEAPADTDSDGMPDEWESRYGLDPANASDGATTTLTGGTYTNLEVYLYDLVRKK
jgi:pectate lyase